MKNIEKKLMHDVIKHESYFEEWKWDVDDVASKVEEIVEWINKHEKEKK